jgi:hypothetical protein
MKEKTIQSYRVRYKRYLLPLLFILVIWALFYLTRALERTVNFIVAEATNHSVELQIERLYGNFVYRVYTSDVDVKVSQGRVRVQADSLDVRLDIFDMIAVNLFFPESYLKNVRVTVLSDTSQKKAGNTPHGGFPPMPLLNLPNLHIDSTRVIVGNSVDIAIGRLTGAFYTDSLQAFMNLEISNAAITDQLHPLQKIRFIAGGDSGHYDIQRLEIIQEGDTLLTRGKMSILPGVPVQFDVNADLSILQLNKWVKISDTTPVINELTVRGQADFKGHYKDFFLDWKAKSIAPSRIYLNDFAGQLYYFDDDWYFPQLLIDSNLGTFRGTGNLSPSKGNFVLATIRNIRLPESLTGIPPLALDAWMNIEIEKPVIQALDGSGGLVLDSLQLGDFRADKIRLQFTAKNGRLVIADSSIMQLTPTSTVSFSGDVHRFKTLNLTAYAYNNALNDYLQPLTGESFEGPFTGLLNLSGPVSDPSLLANIDIDSIRHDLFRTNQVALIGSIDQLVSDPEGYVRFRAFGGSIGNKKISSVLARAAIADNIIRTDGIKLTDGNRELLIRGQVDLNRQMATLDTLDVSYDSYHLFSRMPFTVNWQGDTLKSDSLAILDNFGGRIYASRWTYPLSNRLTNIKLQEFDLAPLSRIMALQFPLSGKLTASLTAKQGKNTPIISGLIIADSLKLFSMDLNTITLNGEYSDDHISFPFLEIEGKSFKLDGRGKWNIANDDQDSKLGIEWHNFPARDLRHFFSDWPDFGGTVSGKIELAGHSRDPDITVNLDVKNAFYRDSKIRHFRSVLNLKNGFLSSDTIFTVIARDTVFADLIWRTNYNIANPVDFAFSDSFYVSTRANITSDSIDLNLIPFVDALSGKMQWDIDAIVTPDEVYFENGRLNLIEANISSTQFTNTFRNVHGIVDFERNQIEIIDVTAESKSPKSQVERLFSPIINLFVGEDKDKGILNINGIVSLNNINKPAVFIDLHGKEIYTQYFPANLETTATIENMRVSLYDSLIIAGDVDVNALNFEVDTDQLAKLQYLYGSTARTIEQQEQLPTDIRIKLSIPGNAFVRSKGFKLLNGFDLEVIGDLTFHQGKSTGIVGQLEVIDGRVSYLKDFDIRFGQVNFLSPRELDATADIIAERSEKNTYLFQFIVKGPLNNLQNQIIVLDALTRQEIKMADKDKIALLVSDFNADSLGQTGEKMLAEATGIALASLARQYHLADKIDFKSDQYIYGAGNINQFIYGKYLTSDLYLEYQGQFSHLNFSGAAIPSPNFTWQAGNQIGVRYRINKNWSLHSTLYRTWNNYNKYRLDIKWKKEF